MPKIANLTVGLLSLSLLFATVPGCGDERSYYVQVQDSSGIRLVRHAYADQPQSSPTEPQLLLSIGGDSAGEYRFRRVSRVFVAADSGFIVADGASAEFRFFDHDGAFLRSSGGRGTAPGQLRYLFNTVMGPDGHLMALDWGHERLHTFSQSGAYVRTDTLPFLHLVPAEQHAEGGFLTPAGDLVVRAYATRTPPTSQISRPLQSLSYLAAGDTLATPIGSFQGAENFCVDAGDRPHCNFVPFFRSLEVTTVHDGVFVGDTDEYVIRLFDATGTVRLVIQRDLARVPISDDDRRAYRSKFTTWLERSRHKELDQKFLDTVPWHTEHPAFTRIFADYDGWLWVQHPAHEGTEHRIWAAYDTGGFLVTEVQLPATYILMDRRGSRLAGINRKQEAEYVEVYEVPLPAS